VNAIAAAAAAANRLLLAARKVDRAVTDRCIRRKPIRQNESTPIW